MEKEPNIFNRIMPDDFEEYLAKKHYDKNNVYINNWHFMHFYSGILFGGIILYFYRRITVESFLFKVIAFHSIWEGFQILIEETENRLKSIPDILIDTLFFTIGSLIVFEMERVYSRRFVFSYK